MPKRTGDKPHANDQLATALRSEARDDNRSLELAALAITRPDLGGAVGIQSLQRLAGNRVVRSLVAGGHVQRSAVDPYSVSEGKITEEDEAAVQAKRLEGAPVQRAVASALPVVSPDLRGADARIIRRVRWVPNVDTGQDIRPWGSGPNGDMRTAATDGGSTINIWSPHNGTTYWCHGYTFGGSTHGPPGPYSVWGQTVPTILADDGWKRVRACLAAPNDILVFYRGNSVLHTGIVRSVALGNLGVIDEAGSRLESKWGQLALATRPWTDDCAQYATTSGSGYRVYSKSPAQGPCAGYGPHELP